MNDKKTNSANDPVPGGSTMEPLSSHDREQCEKIENWISRVQNGQIRGIDTTDRMEQIASSLWTMAQQKSDCIDSTICGGQETDVPFPKIDGYEIAGLIGRGGMGVVYRAMDLQLKRNVALKVLPQNKVGSARAKKRFRIEVQAAAQLEHPAIVPVYEYGEYSGGLYYSMREIDGIDLSRKISLAHTTQESNDEQDPSLCGPPLQPQSIEYQKWVARIGKSVAQALAHSHEQLVIHRDVKPANILIDRSGEPFLSDFGLARISEGSDLTADDDLLGTLRYMSPEQIESGQQQVDGRSDIYSLGITLYELLTGQPAISETNFAAAWKQIREGRIAKPGQINSKLDTDLETIVLKAIALEPEQRYESARHLSDDLQRYLNVMPIQAKRASVGLKLDRWVKRNKNWVAALGLVAGSLLAVIFSFAIYNAWRSARDAETIRQRSAELLDKSGVEKLFRGDSLRARNDFEQAAMLTSDTEEHDRQHLRIAAIDAWSPRMINEKRYAGFLLAHHPSGLEVIAAKNDSNVTCLAKENGKPIKKLFDTNRHLEFATISSDGRFCAIVVGDRTNQDPEVKIYDFRTGKLSAIDDELTWRISDAWFLPDHQSLLTTGWGGAVHIWDVVSGKLMRSMVFENTGANVAWVFAARTDNSKSVMAAVVNPGRIVAYSLPKLEPLWEQPIRISSWRAGAFAISPNGKWMAVGTAEDGIRIWEMESGMELTPANNVVGKPTFARFSMDNQYLAVGDDRGGVYVWKMPMKNSDSVSRQGVVMWHDYSIGTLQFNQQLQLAVGAGNSVRIWRLNDNQPLTPLMPIDSRVRTLAWTAKNDLQVGVRLESEDRHQVWTIPEYLTRNTVDTGSLRKIFSDRPSVNSDPRAARFEVVAISDSSTLELPDHRMPGTDGFSSARAIMIPSNIIKFAFSGDRQRFSLLQPVSNSSCMLGTFDRKSLEQIGETITTPSFPAHIDLNEDGTRWISGGFDEKISVGDVETGKLIHELDLPNWSIDARFLSNGQFASICWDGRLRIWNQEGQEIGVFNHSSIPDQLVSQKEVLIVASGNTLSIYGYDESHASWKRSVEVEHQSGTITHVAINPICDRWVSCGDNGTSIVWSIDGKQIARLPVVGPVSACRFSANGRWLATLSESGAINLWESETGKPMGPSMQGKSKIEFLEWSGDKLLFGGNLETGYWSSDLKLPDSWGF